MSGDWYVVCEFSYSRGGFDTREQAIVAAAECAAVSECEDGVPCRHRIEDRSQAVAPATEAES